MTRKSSKNARRATHAHDAKGDVVSAQRERQQRARNQRKDDEQAERIGRNAGQAHDDAGPRDQRQHDDGQKGHHDALML